MGHIFSNFDNSVQVETTVETNDTVIEIKNDEEIIEIINNIEQEGYEKLGKLKKNVKSENLGEELMNIIQSGADKFKEKTGRPMSYAEMRSAYG